MVSKLMGFWPWSSSSGGNEIVKQASELRQLYAERNKAFERWYELLSLKDKLAQDGMESFVGNDPRTTWNMATYLLQPRPLSNKIVTLDGVALSDDARDTAHVIEQYFNRLWLDIDGRGQATGDPSWFHGYVGMALLTGWSVTPYWVDNKGVVTLNYWNPATVFPEWGEDGLVRLARMRVLSGSQARLVARREGWADGNYANRVTEYQLWIRDGGLVWHGVSFDNQIVKELTPVLGIERIPVLVLTMGGLPDSGEQDLSVLMSTIGQSILATNEPIYNQLNKQQTFMQQLLRDTANPRFKITQVSGKPVLNNPDDLYKRGSIFELGPNDNIEVMTMPAIPMELTQGLFSMRNQLQRGGFSDLTFGNVLQEVTSMLVSQAAEAAMQLIQPYHQAIQYMASTVTNHWYRAFLDNPSIRPKSWPDIPKGDLDNTRVLSSYTVKIPGDLANRVSLTKALSPAFELPQETVAEMLIPEVTNIPDVIAKLDAEKAQMHPYYIQVQLIRAFERLASRSREFLDEPTALLFDSVATRLRQELTGPPTPTGGLNLGPGESQGVIPPQQATNGVARGIV